MIAGGNQNGNHPTEGYQTASNGDGLFTLGRLKDNKMTYEHGISVAASFPTHDEHIRETGGFLSIDKSDEISSPRPTPRPGPSVNIGKTVQDGLTVASGVLAVVLAVTVPVASVPAYAAAIVISATGGITIGKGSIDLYEDFHPK